MAIPIDGSAPDRCTDTRILTQGCLKVELAELIHLNRGGCPNGGRAGSCEDKGNFAEERPLVHRVYFDLVFDYYRSSICNFRDVCMRHIYAKCM